MTTSGDSETPARSLLDALRDARRIIEKASVSLAHRGDVLSVLGELERVEKTLASGHEHEGQSLPTPLERERAARAAAEDAQRRVEFIYEATKTLFSSPLEVLARLERLAALCVPDLADWCMVDIVSAPTSVRRVAVRQWNPERSDRARALEVVYPEDPDARFGICAAMRTGKSELRVVDGPRDASSASEVAFQAILEDLAVKSFLIMPLRAADRTIGAITFLFAESSRRYTEDDAALARDLAARAAFAVDNARLFEELKLAVQGRDDMVAIVSHDLRNPLSSIQMSAELLRASLPRGPDRSKAEIVLRAAERMGHLIRDLLDVTSLEAGKLPLEAKPVDLRAMIAEAIDTARPLAETKELPLRVDIRAAEGFTLLCDPDRILQVLSNVIGNALKFTRSGEIALTVEGTEQQCAFAVSDTGRGIAPEHLPHIFDRFWMGRQAAREGAGLGLFIAKGIVEAHGGVLSVVSVLGQGTTFQFTLPTGGPRSNER